MDKLAVLAVAWGLLFPWTLIALRVFVGYAFYDRLLAGLVGGLAATVSLGYALATLGCASDPQGDVGVEDLAHTGVGRQR